MSIVPQSLLDKYDEFSQHFLDDFGTNCLLVYPPTISTTSNVPNIKQKKTITLQPFDDFSRGSQSYKTNEETEEIRLRLYWAKKDYNKVGNINLPDGGVVGYGLITDLAKVERASELIIYSDYTVDHREWKCTKFAEPIIYGLTQSEFISFWSRNG